VKASRSERLGSALVFPPRRREMILTVRASARQ